MKDQKQAKSENQRSQASKGGQQQPKPTADGGGSRVGPGSSQGLSGAQGSGGGADRGMQQSPKGLPDSLDRND
jgi:hypothetical protein